MRIVVLRIRIAVIFASGIIGKGIYGGSDREKHPTKNRRSTENTDANGYMK